MNNPTIYFVGLILNKTGTNWIMYAYVEKNIKPGEIPTNLSELTNDVGYITSYTETDPTVPSWAKASTKPTYTAAEVGALPSNTVYVSTVNGQSGAITIEEPLVIEGTLTFTLSSTSGSGTFTPTSGDVTKIPTANEVYIKADIHGFSMLSSDYVWLRKMRKASTGMGIVMFNGVFDTAGGAVYVEVEGEPDDEYDWHYATWSVTYRILQQKLTFDSTPTENSTNPVTSGGVYAAIQGGTSSGLIVTVEGHNTNDGYVYTKDKTFAEISAAILANEPCVLVLKDYNAQSYPIRTEVYPANHISSLTGNPTQVWFTKVYSTGTNSVQVSRIIIKSTEAVSCESNYLLITDVYNPSSTNAMSGVAVASAISGFITTETDPTVPAWAKAAQKPTYTADEVGALPSNTTYVSTINGRSGAVTVGEPLVVTITLNASATTTNTMFSADKTYTEISAAVEEGIPCVAIYSGKVYPFSGWYGSSLNFTYECFTHSATNDRKTLTWQTIRINSSNVVSGLGYYDGEQKIQSPQSTYLTVNLPASAGTQGQMLVANATGTGLSWQNQPTIPTVPTDVSAFTNDAGYLTLATLPIYDGTVV